MNRVKKIGAVLSAAFLTLTVVLAGCGSPRDPAEEQARFDEFIEQDFLESAKEEGYTSLHQLFENPEDFGIDMSEVPVELMDTEEDYEEQFQTAKKELAQARQELAGFDRSLLTSEQQETYDICQHQLRYAEQVNQEKFAYIQPLWSADTGVHCQIPMALTELRVSTEQDLKEMLELIGSIPDALDWCVDYTREQEKRGLMMIDFDSVLESCKKQFSAGADHSALADLKAKAANLGLSAQAVQDYQKKLDEAFQRCFTERYKKLYEELSELKNGVNHQGLYSLKNGKEYYEKVVFPGKTANGRSIQETIDLLEYWMNQSIQDLRIAVRQSPKEVQAFFENPVDTTSYKDYRAIVESLVKASEKDFPEIKKPEYEIKKISDEQDASLTLAYYVLCAVDATTADQIRVNPAIQPSSVQMYMTLAHEGWPGHMYQTNFTRENKGLWNQLLTFSGYTEGYASYMEIGSLDYLEGLSQVAREIYRIDTQMNRLLSARADIGIHYEGWTAQDLGEYLQQAGLDASAARDFYNSLQSAEPGLLLPYGVGLAEFLELEDYAQNELESQFDKKAFHEAILRSGPAPFLVVRGYVEEYMESVTGTATGLDRSA